MAWTDELTLITLTPAEEPKNKNGFRNPPIETAAEVYANKLSVTQNEFYKGAMSGMNPRLRFEVYTEEFDDQTIALYNGKRYHILRSYTKGNGDLTEVILSDLPRGGGASDR